MNREELLQLIERVSNSTANDEDLSAYNAWCDSFQQRGEAIPDFEVLKARMYDEITAQISNEGQVIQQERVVPLRLLKRIAVAASILLMLSAGGYFFLHKHNAVPVIADNKQDLAPGADKAILITANGSHILVAEAKSGKLATQGNMVVNKKAAGQIVYQSQSPVEQEAALIYNTVITPKGGKMNLTLSDGTKVWLDAASSITFPVNFSSKERNVAITGEAYFEVAHNANKPFRVKAKGQTVEVLGTHFNVNAYDDEPVICTTLLQGSVKVSNNIEQAILKPGQQSLVVGQASHFIVKDADIEQATAWKDGYFHFSRAGIPQIMRQLSRWYNVDIKYEGKIPTRAFSGDIDRSYNASVALKILSLSKVHFQIEGKTIVVKP